MDLFKLVRDANLPDLYTFEEAEAKDTPIGIKLFTPYSNFTWFISEAREEDNDIIMFGYVKGQANEWGYSSLKELAEIQTAIGPAVEVDLHFGKHNMQEVLDGKC